MELFALMRLCGMNEQIRKETEGVIKGLGDIDQGKVGKLILEPIGTEYRTIENRINDLKPKYLYEEDQGKKAKALKEIK